MDRKAYISEQMSMILGEKHSPSDEVCERWWSALTCEAEGDALRDPHGNVLEPQSNLLDSDSPTFLSLHRDLGGSPSCWGKGYRFAACLSHDVDRIQRFPWRERLRQLRARYGKAPHSSSLRLALSSMLLRALSLSSRRNSAPYDRYVSAEAKFGFHSTFFVLPELLVEPTEHDQYYEFSDQVRYKGRRMTFAEATRQLSAEGWDVGLHGSYSSAYNPSIFTQELQSLEAMLGHSVQSVRQHYLRFDARITPAIQAAAGAKADSTLGFNRSIGCRNGLAFPYFWPDSDLLEVPLSIQDVGMLREPAAASVEESLEQAKQFIDRIGDEGGVVTISWHTHPESPHAYAFYEALLKHVADSGGWGCSLAEINQHWRDRRDRLFPAALRA